MVEFLLTFLRIFVTDLAKVLVIGLLVLVGLGALGGSFLLCSPQGGLR
jgi:hypothetical protein